jgi:hypothetical protein
MPKATWAVTGIAALWILLAVSGWGVLILNVNATQNSSMRCQYFAGTRTFTYGAEGGACPLIDKAMTYNDCILNHERAGMSAQAAALIRGACEAKYR